MTIRDRRALLIGGVVMAGAIVALRVLPWSVRRVITAERGLRDQAALLARARVDLAQARLLRDSAAALAQALVALAPRLLSGSSAAEATADLSGRINLAAGRSGAKLERVDQLSDSARAGRLRRVRLHATLELDVRGVAGILRGVEFGEGALSVTEVRIVALAPTSADGAPEVLRVEITVAGWFLANREAGNGKRET